MIYAVLIIAAVALGLAAFALYVAIVARGRAIDADRRVARHQREHRLGAEETGLRSHRAVSGPSTEQIARVDRREVSVGPPRETGERRVADDPRYARLRQTRDDREGVDLEELPATAEHPAPRPLPSLPPPGRIDR